MKLVSESNGNLLKVQLPRTSYNGNSTSRNEYATQKYSGHSVGDDDNIMPVAFTTQEEVRVSVLGWIDQQTHAGFSSTKYPF